MKAKCLKIDGGELGPPDHGFLYSERTSFSVTRGKEYDIFGMSLYDHNLAYLICNDAKRPDWLPVGLFQLKVAAIPQDWEFRLVEVQADWPVGKWGLQALWGYPELTRSLSHYEGLIDQRASDLALFDSIQDRYRSKDME